MDDAESPTKIAAQIARLQAKLVKAEKRKERDGSAKGGDGPSAVLAGASPSPSKKKKQSKGDLMRQYVKNVLICSRRK